MGAAMLLMMVVLVFAFPSHGFHGMTAHDPDADQRRAQAAPAAADKHTDKHADEPDQQRDSAVPPAQK